MASTETDNEQGLSTQPDELKLTGIAAWSVRLRLLKRLAEGENPIVALAAKDLIRNKAARRVGLWFEMLFVVLFPLIYTIAGIYYALGYYYHLWDVSASGGFNFTEDVVSMSLMIVGFLSFFAYLLGFHVLLRPMMILVNRELKGSLFRFIPMNPKDLFKGLLKLQFISFAIYPIFYYIFGLILGIVTAPDYLAIPDSSVGNFLLFGFVNGVALIIYISIISVYTGLHYVTSWGNLVALVSAIVVINVFSEIVPYGIIMVLYQSSFSNGDYEDWFKYSRIAPLIMILVFLALSVFLAYTTVVKRLMPKR